MFTAIQFIVFSGSLVMVKYSAKVLYGYCVMALLNSFIIICSITMVSTVSENDFLKYLSSTATAINR